MTRFEELKNMGIETLAEWLDDNCVYDGSPWCKYWDEHYCSKCDGVTAYVPDFDAECEFAWCELNGKCRFFQDMNDIPSCKEIVQMWLESEVGESS